MSEHDTYYREKWKIDAFGKLYYVIFLIIVIAVGFLVGLFQKAVIYRIDSELTTDAVTALKDEYAGCTVIDQAKYGTMHSFLLENTEQQYIVTLEKHRNAERYRLVRAGTFEVEDETTKAIFGDYTTLRMTVSEEAIQSYTGTQSGLQLSSSIQIPLSSILYTIVILAAIFGIAALFRKLRS